ncbi:hypothetical protein PENSPDRAFT_694898 [Peniophora sp. CONT]|nr:hypothetical protein PENSPDRAFT_694898 [Peniophora sp. CONT]
MSANTRSKSRPVGEEITPPALAAARASAIQRRKDLERNNTQARREDVKQREAARVVESQKPPEGPRAAKAAHRLGYGQHRDSIAPKVAKKTAVVATPVKKPPAVKKTPAAKPPAAKKPPAATKKPPPIAANEDVAKYEDEEDSAYEEIPDAVDSDGEYVEPDEAFGLAEAFELDDDPEAAEEVAVEKPLPKRQQNARDLLVQGDATGVRNHVVTRPTSKPTRYKAIEPDDPSDEEPRARTASVYVAVPPRRASLKRKSPEADAESAIPPPRTKDSY